MGVLIILDIVPQRIEPRAWAEVWDEARRLLSAHPAELVGYDWITIAGVPLPVYTRGVERSADDPVARRIVVTGDRAAMSAGPQQTVFRDLDRYLARCPPETEPRDDILLAAAGVNAARAPAFPVPTTPPRAHAAHVRDGMVRVLGDEPCATPCALPLLAAAMVVEARLPRRAMVHGEIDREQAEAARRWAEAVLGPERPIALPVRVDAWRLVERLGSELRGPALVRAVDRLHLAAPGKKDAALLSIFGHAEADAWWLDKRRLAGRAGDDRPAASSRSPAPAGGDDSDGNALAATASPADLTAAQREEVLAIARAAKRDVTGREDRAAWVHDIAGALAERGPTLTEAAWDWIVNEDDADVLRLLAALAADTSRDTASARRALFENRALCRWASASR